MAIKLFSVLTDFEKMQVKKLAIARNVYIHDLTIQELGELNDVLEAHHFSTHSYRGSLRAHAELIARQNEKA